MKLTETTSQCMEGKHHLCLGYYGTRNANTTCQCPCHKAVKEWKVYESPFAPAIVIEGGPNQPRRIIAVCRLERGSEDMAEAVANAHLIVAAVNGCISINADNPRVVAESIKGVYEALKAFPNTSSTMKAEEYSDLVRSWLANYWYKALAKVEGREQ